MTPQKLGPYETGDSVEFEVDVTHEDGSTADLTAMTAHVHLARADDLTAVVASSDNAPPTVIATILDPVSNGVVNVKIPTLVSSLLLGTYAWRVVLRDATNQDQLVARGYIDFIARINP